MQIWHAHVFQYKNCKDRNTGAMIKNWKSFKLKYLFTGSSKCWNKIHCIGYVIEHVTNISTETDKIRYELSLTRILQCSVETKVERKPDKWWKREPSFRWFLQNAKMNETEKSRSIYMYVDISLLYMHDDIQVSLTRLLEVTGVFFIEG